MVLTSFQSIAATFFFDITLFSLCKRLLILNVGEGRMGVGYVGEGAVRQSEAFRTQ